jgi:hypothetical protein
MTKGRRIKVRSRRLISETQIKTEKMERLEDFFIAIIENKGNLKNQVQKTLNLLFKESQSSQFPTLSPITKYF